MYEMTDNDRLAALSAAKRSSRTATEIEELRDILIKDERIRIQQLEQDLADPTGLTDSVSRILPGALYRSSKEDQESLTQSLIPSVEKAIQISVKKDPKSLVNAIFPVMGPAIRKAVAQTFKEMLQSLNRSLEHGLSIQGIKWRVEAMRTSRPFAEVVLLNSLLYSVDQVFLIHKKTSLCLQHMQADTVIAQDEDMVSGMLSAILDFVRDSFDPTNKGYLDTVRVGELNVLIEEGPQAILACVVRGNAPETLRQEFTLTLEKIHERFSGYLGAFEGDITPFEEVRPLMETCLKRQAKVKKRRFSPLTWMAMTVPIFLLGIWLYPVIESNRRWNGYLETIDNISGVTVVESGKRDGKRFVKGLRDPLAPDPESYLSAAGFAGKDVSRQWILINFLNPDLLLKRVKEKLRPPEGVQLSLKPGGMLTMAGRAGHRWIFESRMILRAMSGVSSVDTQALVAVEEETMAQTIRALEAFIFRYNVGKTLLLDGQEDRIRDCVSTILTLRRLSIELKRPITISLIGHTDPSGSERTNVRLSMQRAQNLREVLKGHGVPPNILILHGASTTMPVKIEFSNNEDLDNRSVTFSVNQRYTQ